MDVMRIVRIARRWVLLLVACPVLATLVTVAISYQLAPTYQSQVSVLVRPAQILPGDATGTNTTADQVTHTYATLMGDRALVKQVATQLGLPVDARSLDSLQKQVSINPLFNTTVIVVSVQSTDPALAQKFANTLVDDFIAQTHRIQQQQVSQYTTNIQNQMQQVGQSMSSTQAAIDKINQTTPQSAADANKMADLQQQLTTLRAQYTQLVQSLATLDASNARSTDNLAVVTPASLPQEPISPRIPLNALLAFIAGVLVALVTVILLEYLDQSVKSDEELTARTGLVPIGHIQFTAGQDQKKLGELVALESTTVAEGYRTLRTNLLFSGLDREIKTIAITSSNPGEGKSRTAANLAAVLASAGFPTLLVDADFRRPSQHKIFGRVRNTGLSNMILQDQIDADSMLPVPEVPNLWLLTSGPTPPNPSELLGSARLRAMITRLRQRFAYVVIDTPPVNAVTDACVLANDVDAVIIVVEQGVTGYPAVVHAKAALDRVGANIVGCVVNKLKAPGLGYYYSYSYYGRDYGSTDPAAEPASVNGKAAKTKTPASSERR